MKGSESQAQAILNDTYINCLQCSLVWQCQQKRKDLRHCPVNVRKSLTFRAGQARGVIQNVFEGFVKKVRSPVVGRSSCPELDCDVLYRHVHNIWVQGIIILKDKAVGCQCFSCLQTQGPNFTRKELFDPQESFFPRDSREDICLIECNLQRPPKEMTTELSAGIC